VSSRRPSFDERVAGLAAAVDAARGRLDDGTVEAAAGVVARAGQRLRLSGEHTVVALAGATGSGKSSTFNSLVGVDIAAVGVRRPTTSQVTACVWGEDPADELLDWLEVPQRRRVAPDSALDSGQTPAVLDGLVLLDLPDHDSTEVEHHLEVERLTAMTDVMVWVLDPQKYADAAVHRRFLAPLARHRDVMVIVLNRVDEVREDDRAPLLADVRRLLEADGLGDVPLMATSARTGEGMADLRALLARRVKDKAAARARLAADVAGVAERLAAQCGDAEPPRLGDRDQRALVEALATAAGVPVVVDAVRRATTMRTRRATGWPLTAWLSRLRPDPLRRLHLEAARSKGRSGRDVLVQARTSLPAASPVQRAQVESSVRDLSGSVSADLPAPWARAVRAASTSRFGDLEDALDQAMTSTGPANAALPWWSKGVRAVQWVLLLAALAGVVWLGGLAVLSWLRVPQPGTPEYRGVPVPTLLLVGGVALGLLLALLCRGLVWLTARSRGRSVERRLRAAVAEVARDLVLEPVETELAAYAATRTGLRRARG
jgi:GTP-binding protein EngB required for normal cell division